MSGRPNLDMLGQELRRGEVDYGPLDGTEVLAIFSGPGQPGRPHEGRKRLSDIGYGVNTVLENTAVYDPVSLVTGAVGPIQTMAIPLAALGDFVVASFSLDLQGVDLKAWVSAPDTVQFQFRNPTAATIDLASGTVKCRVIK